MNYIDGDVELFQQSNLTKDDLKEWIAIPRPNSTHGQIIEEDDDDTERRADKKRKEEEERLRKLKESTWDVSKSLFAGYVQDTDDLMNRCFKFDWRCSRIEKLL